MKTTASVVWMVAIAALTGCAGGPGMNWGNTDRSDERRAEAACRYEAGTGPGSAGAEAAYQACMAEFRRPERED